VTAEPAAAGARATIYAALLRGINVGGNNIVPMQALKSQFERLGFEDVRTYINSGNVIFRAGGADPRHIEERIDRMMSRDLGVPGRTVVRTHAEMARVVGTIAKTWTIDAAWRYNVMFLRHTIDSPDVLAGIELKHDIERVVYCPGTLLWSVRADAAARTAMLKLGSRPIYREMTVRNVNTTKKVFDLMTAALEGTQRG
jgi:uncharacterized protein (DUF1697 family)